MRGWLYPMDGAHLWGGDRKTSGGKGGKGGNPLQKSGASDSSTISIISTRAAAAALRRSAWREPAETGGNSLQKRCSEKLSAVLLSHPRGANWRNARGNCGNCGKCHLTYTSGARDS